MNRVYADVAAQAQQRRLTQLSDDNAFLDVQAAMRQGRGATGGGGGGDGGGGGPSGGGGGGGAPDITGSALSRLRGDGRVHLPASYASQHKEYLDMWRQVWKLVRSQEDDDGSDDDNSSDDHRDERNISGNDSGDEGGAPRGKATASSSSSSSRKRPRGGKALAKKNKKPRAAAVAKSGKVAPVEEEPTSPQQQRQVCPVDAWPFLALHQRLGQRRHGRFLRSQLPPPLTRRGDGSCGAGGGGGGSSEDNDSDSDDGGTAGEAQVPRRPPMDLRDPAAVALELDEGLRLLTAWHAMQAAKETRHRPLGGGPEPALPTSASSSSPSSSPPPPPSSSSSLSTVVGKTAEDEALARMGKGRPAGLLLPRSLPAPVLAALARCPSRQSMRAPAPPTLPPAGPVAVVQPFALASVGSFAAVAAAAAGAAGSHAGADRTGKSAHRRHATTSTATRGGSNDTERSLVPVGPRPLAPGVAGGVGGGHLCSVCLKPAGYKCVRCKTALFCTIDCHVVHDATRCLKFIV